MRIRAPEWISQVPGAVNTRRVKRTVCELGWIFITKREDISSHREANVQAGASRSEGEIRRPASSGIHLMAGRAVISTDVWIINPLNYNTHTRYSWASSLVSVCARISSGMTKFLITVLANSHVDSFMPDNFSLVRIFIYYRKRKLYHHVTIFHQFANRKTLFY